MALVYDFRWRKNAKTTSKVVIRGTTARKMDLRRNEDMFIFAGGYLDRHKQRWIIFAGGWVI